MKEHNIFTIFYKKRTEHFSTRTHITCVSLTGIVMIRIVIRVAVSARLHLQFELPEGGGGWVFEL